jgi:hypothetical protein
MLPDPPQRRLLGRPNEKAENRQAPRPLKGKEKEVAGWSLSRRPVTDFWTNICFSVHCTIVTCPVNAVELRVEFELFVQLEP